MFRLPILRQLRGQFAVVIAAAMLPAGVVAFIQATSNADREANQRLALLESEAQIRASEVRDVLVEVREAMRTTALGISRATAAGHDCEGPLSVLTDTYGWATRSFVLNDKGEAVCGVDSKLSVAEFPEWEEFRIVPRFTVGPVRVGRITKNEIVVAYSPIPSRSKDMFGLAIGLRIESLRRIIETEVNEDHPFALLGDNGGVIATRDSDGKRWLPEDSGGLLGNGTRIERRTGADGIARDYIAHPLVPGEVWALTGVNTVSLWSLMVGPQGLAIITPIVLWAIAVGVAFIAIDRLVTRHVSYLQRVAERIGEGEFETEIRRFDGAPQEIRRLGLAIGQMARSISERETRLKDLLGTQKSLLLEVHHRVKNNLQMISSLMNIQLRRVRSDQEREVLQLVQDRIHGLALVHQNLYATERLDHVALDQLVRDVCDHLATSLKPVKSEVHFRHELDHVTVDASIATPVALFLTEAIGNVFKHGLSQAGVSEIDVRLLTPDETEFVLTVANEKRASASGASPEPATGTAASGTNGLGTRLMMGFAKQLGGTMDSEMTEDKFSVTLRAPKSERGHAFSISSDRPAEGERAEPEDA